MKSSKSFKMKEIMKTRQATKANLINNSNNLQISKEATSITRSPEKPQTIQTKKSTTKSSKKRKRETSESDIDEDEKQIDQQTELYLQACAKKNNFAPDEMKKLLKKIVGNDHVLALVKIQEEAEIAQELRHKEELLQQKQSSVMDSMNDKNSSNDDTSTPKLTRAKFRELNKDPLEIPSLNKTDPEPEVVALISEDLKSDEDDDEYEPREEDFVSEDDLNTTASDLDSQPRTPLTPFHGNDQDSPIRPTACTRFTSDGLFKIPRERNNDILSTQKEEIIATRTRSKFCLEETPIEILESTFIPPDVPSDMYNLDAELDSELDSEWMEFLHEFTKPLNSNVAHEEDDEADPEYVAAEKIPLDAEELRNVNISKKELSDLVAELFDGLVQDGVISNDVSDDDNTIKKFPTDKILPLSPQKRKAARIIEQQTIPNYQSSQNNTDNSDYTQLGNQSFHPVINSTPVTYNKIETRIPPGFVNYQAPPYYGVMQQQFQPYNIQSNYQQQIVPTTLNNYLYTPISSSIPVLSSQQQPLVNSTPQTTIVEKSPSSSSRFNINNPNTRTVIAYPVPGAITPCYQIAQISPSSLNQGSLFNLSNPQPGQPLLAQIKDQTPVAYIDLTQNNTDKTTRQKTKYITNPDIFEMWRGDAHISAHKYYKQFYQNKYANLQNEPEVVECNYPNNIVGFTPEQRQIFDQQMRIHVQLIAQNFLQTYCHPQFWKLAKPMKEMAQELEQNCKDNVKSAFNAWNLKSAITLMNDWETELSEDTEENNALMDFIHHQIDRSQTRACLVSSRIIQFPPRIMKLILKSTVFMYPEYIPRLPFVNKYKNVYTEFAPIESHILAFGLQKYFEEVEAEAEAKREIYRRYSLIKLTCIKIAENIMLGKTSQRIYDYYKAQLADEHYNPIKYYNEKQKAPKFHHHLIPINLDSVLPPEKRLPDLPMVWKEFGTTLKLSKKAKRDHEIAIINTKKSIKHTSELNWSKERTKRQKQKENFLNQSTTNADDSINNSSNVVIHLNYIFDNSILNSVQNQTTTYPQITEIDNHNCTTIDYVNNQENNVVTNIIENAVSKTEHTNSTTSSTDITKFCSKIHEHLNLTEHDNHNLCKTTTTIVDNNHSNLYENQQISTDNILLPQNGQKLLTDFYEIVPNYQKYNLPQTNTAECTVSTPLAATTFHISKVHFKKPKKRKLHRFKRYHKKRTTTYLIPKLHLINKRFRKLAIVARKRRRLENKFKNLLVLYWAYLYKIYKYYHNYYLKKVFVNLKALELYTNFLRIRKMNCKKNMKLLNGGNNNCTTTTTDDLNITNNNKKSKNIDDEAAKLKKAHRLGESLRQMLLPDNQEESNKKDAIYAYNFYEKVEEAFTNCGKEKKFQTFQKILKEFDPQKHKVADLYYKIENLFLPNHPELAEVFLTFLLPSEAVQVGKFFEHFLITNMGTFINKLNIYFSKQPAQIRKIYNSLNDMAEDPDINMEKIKLKILPLLKGNQFLIDWFMQIFPNERPPDSVLTYAENLCLKEVESQQGVFCETVSPKELIEDSNENQPCQLRYINGRLFYGSRILLPAKLAFMAQNITKLEEINNEINANNMKCVHGIREFAENRLKSNIIENNNTQSSCEENDKSEDEDQKAENATMYEICDEAEFRMHATRLNSALYGSEGCSSSFYKSKSSYEENYGKTSPKKPSNRSTNSYQSTPILTTPKDNKRKSPKKNFIKSPNSNSNGSTGSIKRHLTNTDPSTSNAIQTAKKLKACISTEDDQIDIHKLPKKRSNKNCNKSSTLSIRAESPIPSTSSSTVPSSCSNKSTEITKSNSEKTEIITESVTTVNTSAAWTREEDKIILEEVKNCQVSSITVGLLERLTIKLTERRKSEILTRHEFLMDLLSQFQKRKATA